MTILSSVLSMKMVMKKPNGDNISLSVISTWRPGGGRQAGQAGRLEWVVGGGRQDLLFFPCYHLFPHPPLPATIPPIPHHPTLPHPTMPMPVLPI